MLIFQVHRFRSPLAIGAIGALLFLAAHVGGRAASVAPSSMRVIVAPGDTLWTLAQRAHVHEDDLRDAIDRIMQDNGLASPALTVGQTLVIRP